MGPQSSQLATTLAASDREIRLLLDGRKLGHGGIGVYVENLIHGLQQIGGVSLTVIATEAQAKSFACAESVRWIFDAARPYSFDELVLLPRRLDFSRFDIFHTPHYVLPFGISIPTVVTVHDLIHVHHPEAFFYPFIATRLIRSALSRADAVVAVSRDTARALREHTRPASDKIRHIPNAVPMFIHDGALSNEAPRDPFFLVVLSNIKPHKGLRDLLLAYREFRRRLRQLDRRAICPALTLVGFGAAALRDDRELSALASSVEGVEVVGAVESERLRSLYRAAHALVVPSIAEGFCLPALEAQACGTPVICRPVPALEELLTEHDIVAGDLSVRALEVALLEGAAREVSARRVVPEHLARFAPEVVATAVRDLYAEVINARKRR